MNQDVPLKTEGMGWRVGVSIVTFFGSIIAVILWLFFYAGSFNVYQNIAVVVVTLLAFIALMGATWAPWGLGQRSDWWSSKSQRAAKPYETLGDRT
jgi:protein-S-isoprenylcysteine O-methyltransferase Ste14